MMSSQEDFEREHAETRSRWDAYYAGDDSQCPNCGAELFLDECREECGFRVSGYVDPMSDLEGQEYRDMGDFLGIDDDLPF